MKHLKQSGLMSHYELLFSQPKCNNYEYRKAERGINRKKANDDKKQQTMQLIVNLFKITINNNIIQYDNEKYHTKGSHKN